MSDIPGYPHGWGRSTRHWREIVRPYCLRRDMAADAPCHLCGQPIDYHAPAQSPDAWEPDHDPPLSVAPRYGEDPSHIKPSHCSCNRSRQASASDGNAIGEPSEAW
ncbi:hypothetical protein [Bifidobacterium simiiventris]|uniref:hypothetical protein n=1 Tax=Bifidobacterium simiiventris TaxID=2834434 RepID=UPI001C5934B5|nr:hypothetical protein [Bifidobacterium simiiventris]MBW3077700.1 hypothetical protein [Bifidobacterium simiiventris]